ncbi:MAG: ABC transporter permease, partial [Acidobacteriia bacterium]|nr:ABC transporter permease [Terriglobia bacterium]
DRVLAAGRHVVLDIEIQGARSVRKAYPTPESVAIFILPPSAAALVSDGRIIGLLEGGSAPEVKERLSVRLKLVDPWYFGTLQIPVESGRGIEDRDRAGAPPVMVINQEAARHLSSRFGMANPVGRAVGIDWPGYGTNPGSGAKVQIVGVIRSERTGGLHAPEEPVAYLPLAQVPRQEIKLVLSTKTEPLAVMSGIREAVRQVDPNLPLGYCRGAFPLLEAAVDASLSSWTSCEPGG